MGRSELMRAVEYRAGKYLDDAVVEAAGATAERFRADGHDAMAYDEVIVVGGQAARITYEVEPVTQEEVLRELAAELSHGAEAMGGETNEQTADLALFLRRSAYEGRLRGLPTHLVAVEAALEGLDGGAFDEGDWRVAYVRPYLITKRDQIVAILEENDRP